MGHRGVPRTGQHPGKREKNKRRFGYDKHILFRPKRQLEPLSYVFRLLFCVREGALPLARTSSVARSDLAQGYGGSPGFCTVSLEEKQAMKRSRTRDKTKEFKGDS